MAKRQVTFSPIQSEFCQLVSQLPFTNTTKIKISCKSFALNNLISLRESRRMI